MNDITALPTVTPEMLASLKLSAMNLAEGEMMSFEPAVFRALVEALEKAQSAKRTLESLGYTDNGGELWKPPVGPKPNFSLMDSYRHRIAELESRAVKLPDRKTAGDYIDDTFDPSDLAAVHNACRLQCKNALTAAGIQVIEGEGQCGGEL